LLRFGEKIDQKSFNFIYFLNRKVLRIVSTPAQVMCAEKFPLRLMGDRAEGQACADPGARIPIGASVIATVHILPEGTNIGHDLLTLWVTQFYKLFRSLSLFISTKIRKEIILDMKITRQ
jgi:hypothetical protein